MKLHRHESLFKKFSDKRSEAEQRIRRIQSSAAEVNQAIRLIGKQVEEDIEELKLLLEELDEVRDRIADGLDDDFRELGDDERDGPSGRSLRRWIKSWRNADANPGIDAELPELLKVSGLEDWNEITELATTPPA